MGYNLSPMANTFSQTYLRRHIALPGEHGAWVFLLSPLLIGLAAGGKLTIASLYLVIALLAAFFLRQPVTIAVKAYSGRRSRRDLPAARFWMLVYGTIALLAVISLVAEGYGYVLILAVPGIPVFIWHMYLVSKRAERRQIGVEVVGSGVLALAAPAAYWIAIGSTDPIGWWLFILTWLQSAASIVYAYLRLEQRELSEIPSTAIRLRMGRRALMYTSFNLLAVSIFSLSGSLPSLLPVPYALQWAESIWGIMKPAVGVKPTKIGLRQLVVSTLFTILFILTWNYSY
ncbi:MAG: YwiC-like family protein [Anaerolineales bacterium]|nr:YwiC-like family protein [Anaerolineales bacterium]